MRGGERSGWIQSRTSQDWYLFPPQRHAQRLKACLKCLLRKANQSQRKNLHNYSTALASVKVSDYRKVPFPSVRFCGSNALWSQDVHFPRSCRAVWLLRCIAPPQCLRKAIQDKPQTCWSVKYFCKTELHLKYPSLWMENSPLQL